MKHNVVIMVNGKPVEAVLRIGTDNGDDEVYTNDEQVSASEEATEADYQAALARLGVQ